MKDLSKKVYSLCEAVADVAHYAGVVRYYTGDSREDMAQFISWAQEFEEIHTGRAWGVDEGPDYIEAIEAFTDDKIRAALGKTSDLVRGCDFARDAFRFLGASSLLQQVAHELRQAHTGQGFPHTDGQALTPDNVRARHRQAKALDEFINTF